MGLTLTISYPFIKHIPIAASHFIVAPGYAGQNNGMPHYHFVHGLPSSMERESAVMKCRVAPGKAKTGNRDNDTPVQSQSERDSVFQRKAVAGLEYQMLSYRTLLLNHEEFYDLEALHQRTHDFPPQTPL